MIAVFGGAALVVLGSFLPWVEATVPFLGSVSFDGTEGDGKLTLVLGFAVALGLIRHAAWRVVGMLAAVGTLGIALYDIGDIANAVDEAAAVGATASVGTGLWAVLIGSLACIVGIVQRSGWLDRWGTRRYYAMGAICVVMLAAGIVLSDTVSSGDAGAELGDPFASEDAIGLSGTAWEPVECMTRDQVEAELGEPISQESDDLGAVNPCGGADCQRMQAMTYEWGTVDYCRGLAVGWVEGGAFGEGP